MELWLLVMVVTVSVTFNWWFLRLVLSKVHEVSYFVSLLLEYFTTFIVFNLDKRLLVLCAGGMRIIY